MILIGDACEQLQTLPDESVNCCVTSPPYYGLRDYGIDGQIGLEDTPQEYVQKLVDVFHEVKRVLRHDGTCWINLGDSYNSNNGFNRCSKGWERKGRKKGASDKKLISDLKPKNLLGIPWRVAFALQDDGWYLRQDIIWHKPNPMPESVKDRCTKAHEYIFLLTKSAKYWYDAEAIMEKVLYDGRNDTMFKGSHKYLNISDNYANKKERWPNEQNGVKMRNKRSIWTIATKPYKDAHFATFPPEIPELCIKAGCPKGGTVLDPFSGAGTTGMIAERLGCTYIVIDINPEYVDMSKERIYQDAPLFNQHVL